MKKLLILVVLLMVLLTACAPAQTQDTNASGDELACHNITVLSTRKEYEAFISTNRLPNDFVHLDSISYLGTFRLFIPYYDFPNQYEYTFHDPDGWQIDFIVKHGVKTERDLEISVTPDMTSMKKISSKERPFIKRNGVEYRYGESGYIMAIVWHDNNTEFVLTGHLSSSTSSLVNRLLSISETEAAEAVSELKAFLTK